MQARISSFALLYSFFFFFGYALLCFENVMTEKNGSDIKKKLRLFLFWQTRISVVRHRIVFIILPS